MSAVFTTSSTTGFTSFSAGDIYVIAPGVQYSSSSSSPAFRDVVVHTGVTLINYGAFIAAIAPGAVFEPGGTLRNEGDALISGTNGVQYPAGSLTVDNLGRIIGFTGHGISAQSGASGLDISNGGYIFGKLGGITVTSGSATAVNIVNYGAIESDQYGLYLINAVAQPVVENSGTIRGKVASIFADNGDAIDLDNSGVLFGNVVCQSSIGNTADIIRNSGKIVGNVLLGAGNDSFDGRGGTTRSILGESGNDVLIGGVIAERIDGGLGQDVMTGGPGGDIFDFNAIADSAVGAGRDQINGFSRAQGDRIDLSTIDADQTAGHAGNQAFVFIGAQTFAARAGSGEVRYAGGIIQVNVDADSAPDMEIRVGAALVASDFVL